MTRTNNNKGRDKEGNGGGEGGANGGGKGGGAKEGKGGGAKAKKETRGVGRPPTSCSKSTTKNKGKGATTGVQAPKCQDCEVEIEDETPAMNCTRCQEESAWKCIECAGISEDLYELLSCSSTNSLHWFCNDCEKEVTKQACGHIEAMLEKVLKQTSEIKLCMSEKADNTAMAFLEERIAALEIKPSMERSVEPSLQAIDNGSLSKLMSEAVANQTEEEKEVESRKNNIIIYRIPESNAEEKDTRAAYDRSFITALCEGPLETGPINDKISTMIRLGKRQEGAASRPLLVKFEDGTAKGKVMGNLRKLKSAEEKFKKVSVAHDLTPKQREAVKSVLRVAQVETNAVGNNEEKGNFKIRVVGHLHKPKVIRIKTNQ